MKLCNKNTKMMMVQYQKQSSQSYKKQSTLLNNKTFFEGVKIPETNYYHKKRYNNANRMKCLQYKNKTLIRAELGGQYDESYEDISRHLIDLFTYKALKTVLSQLSETDPTNYKWLYNFSVQHKASPSYPYCKLLIKEHREIGERILKTRLNLLSEWLKKCDGEKLLIDLNQKNLEVLRDSLKDSINFIYTAKPRPHLKE